MLRLRIERTWDDAPAREDETVSLTLRHDREHLLVTVDAPFHDDPPPPVPPGPTDRLWEHEVVELFVLHDSAEGLPRYTEIELGPHGHHLVLQLEGVRQVVERALPLAYRPRILGGRWEADVHVPTVLLPPPPHRWGAFAIHGVGPGRRYLALFPGPPGPAPDFHRLETYEPLRTG